MSAYLKSSNQCPFGAALQRYWDNRYQYFSRFDKGIQIDAEGLHTVMPEQAARTQARLFKSDVIIDAFAGVGGCSIAMAREGKRVIAVELDQSRLQMAQHNARLYQVDHLITFINADIFSVINNLDAEAINIDPPWGWPSKNKIDTFQLKHFGLDCAKLLNIALDSFREVLLRAPKNFSLSELSFTKKSFSVHDDLLNETVVSKSILFNRD